MRHGLKKSPAADVAGEVSALADTKLREKMLHALDEVAQPKDWNGPSTVQTKPASLALAREFIELLASIDLPLPFIGPMASGGVSFEWDGHNTGSRELAIFFIAPEPISFVAALPATGYEESSETRKIQDLRRYLEWLSGHIRVNMRLTFSRILKFR